MHKSATKCNETIGKWCKNKHGASKIIDTLETYHRAEQDWPPLLEPPSLLDLLPHQPKVLDLRGIEGGGLDQHPHRSDSLSPLICLRDLCLGFPWNPRPWFLYLISCYLLFDSIVLFLGASNSVVDACPKLVKAGSTLSNPLVESELGLCGASSHLRIGWAFVALPHMWHPGSGLNKIDRILISTRYTFFLEAYLKRIPG
jgi:hypothetical protein